MRKISFSLFVAFVVFIIWFTINRIRTSKKGDRLRESYWERENQANSTRRQDLDKLPYLQIPLDSLPFSSLRRTIPKDERLTGIEEDIRALAGQKIVNFTGVSNTDLKLEYGASNLELLTEYDENFTLLCRLLYQWGSLLNELSLPKEAAEVLEYGIRIGTDIRAHYLLLGTLYKNASQSRRIHSLIEIAGTLNSLNKNSIIRGLVSLQNPDGTGSDDHGLE